MLWFRCFPTFRSSAWEIVFSELFFGMNVLCGNNALLYFFSNKMTIYIDVVFIENLIMNIIILIATCIILKVKIIKTRIFFASMIGAVYTIMAYMTSLKIFSNFFIKFILSVVIVYVSFYPQNFKKMWKYLIVFYLTSFIFGGVAFFLIYVIKPQNILIKNGLFLGTYTLKTVLLSAFVALGIIFVAFKFIKSRISKDDLYKNLNIVIDGKNVNVDVMLDTGNTLKDPISEKPVIIVERTCMYGVFPKEILDNIENILGGDMEKIPNDIKENYIKKLKIIPFSSLGKENGMLLGMKPDYIEIVNEENKKKVKDVIIGIYGKSLTKDGKYKALMGIDIV